MVEDPERERMRKERQRQDAVREAAVLRDAQRRGEKETKKAYDDLKDVDKAAYEKNRLRAEAAAEAEPPAKTKPRDLIDRLRQKPAKGRGFRRRGERDKDRER